MKEIYTWALPGFLLLQSAFFLHPAVHAQNALEESLPTSEGEVVFTRVNELQEKEIQDHLQAAKNWFLKNGFSVEKVQEDDPSRDILEGRGAARVLWGPNNFEQYFKSLKFKIEVTLKKDRYRYRFDEFVVKDETREAQLEIYQTDTKLGARYNPDFYREIENMIRELTEDLQATLSEDQSDEEVPTDKGRK